MVRLQGGHNSLNSASEIACGACFRVLKVDNFSKSQAACFLDCHISSMRPHSSNQRLDDTRLDCLIAARNI